MTVMLLLLLLLLLMMMMMMKRSRRRRKLMMLRSGRAVRNRNGRWSRADRDRQWACRRDGEELHCRKLRARIKLPCSIDERDGRWRRMDAVGSRHALIIGWRPLGRERSCRAWKNDEEGVRRNQPLQDLSHGGQYHLGVDDQLPLFVPEKAKVCEDRKDQNLATI